MDRWEPISLTSASRPILDSHEIMQTTQDQIGLYDGRQKAEDYPNGTVYLTSYRLLYIDAKDPKRKSIGLDLRYIKGMQHYGGFMSSSPKITLDLYTVAEKKDEISGESSHLSAEESNTTAATTTTGTGAGLSHTSTSPAMAAWNSPMWICAICSNSNSGDLVKCAICGIKRPAATGERPSSGRPNPYASAAAKLSLLDTPSHLSLPRKDSPVLADQPLLQSDSYSASTPLSSSPSPLPAPPTTNNDSIDPPKLTCTLCTFHNDPFMIQCEMCGNPLQDADTVAFALERQQQHQRSISHLPSTIAPSSATSGSSTTISPSPNTIVASGDDSKRYTGAGGLISSFSSMMYARTSVGLGKSKTDGDEKDKNCIKLSFRGGGSTNFYSTLRSTMALKAWERKPVAMKPQKSRPKEQVVETAPPVPRVGGISGIMRTVETAQKQNEQTLSSAFQDLQALMDMAAEMVTMAENFSSQISRSNSSGLNTEETATFKSYLLSMGIAAPVTKDTAGAVFHKELARELAEFILPFVEREGGMLSLTDTYCVFNRARGVELVSPKDLHTACQQFVDLNLPLRLRKFESGLVAIQTLARHNDDEVAATVLKAVQDLPPGLGITAVELARVMQISVVLAQDQLLGLET
ncbi:hypothetical protein DFQ27_000772 [Actinomortierella ambigua]|uniref:Vacuolar protein-sorting-associated protein 36 n=1 Tax=Actinomortierella ambigua TaxID=1343610 RepID=A0A9P6QE40_9FUNG|nr:hypothetical protein DFQ27_000772 [Actinomortierella ambigua]